MQMIPTVKLVPPHKLMVLNVSYVSLIGSELPLLMPILFVPHVMMKLMTKLMILLPDVTLVLNLELMLLLLNV
jgi:hypothetical protein